MAKPTFDWGSSGNGALTTRKVKQVFSSQLNIFFALGLLATTELYGSVDPRGPGDVGSFTSPARAKFVCWGSRLSLLPSSSTNPTFSHLPPATEPSHGARAHRRRRKLHPRRRRELGSGGSPLGAHAPQESLVLEGIVPPARQGEHPRRAVRPRSELRDPRVASLDSDPC